MKKILLVLSILFSTILSSQDLTLKGTVFEKETDFVLPGATVQVIGSDNGIVTDFDGNIEGARQSEDYVWPIPLIEVSTNNKIN